MGRTNLKYNLKKMCGPRKPYKPNTNPQSSGKSEDWKQPLRVGFVYQSRVVGFGEGGDPVVLYGNNNPIIIIKDWRRPGVRITEDSLIEYRITSIWRHQAFGKFISILGMHYGKKLYIDTT